MKLQQKQSFQIRAFSYEYETKMILKKARLKEEFAYLICMLKVLNISEISSNVGLGELPSGISEALGKYQSFQLGNKNDNGMLTQALSALINSFGTDIRIADMRQFLLCAEREGAFDDWDQASRGAIALAERAAKFSTVKRELVKLINDGIKLCQPVAKSQKEFIPKVLSEITFPSYSKASDVYFFASDAESDYPTNISKIEVRGGTAVAVAGGMEHDFAYWVVNQPDRIVLYDVNPWAIKLAQAKCELILKSENYKEFIARFNRIFKGEERFVFTSVSANDISELVLAGIKLIRCLGSLNPRCDQDNGWDKPEEFNTLKNTIRTKTILYVHGDILNIDFRNYRDVSLIFISDIFDMTVNDKLRSDFVKVLRQHQNSGHIRRDAQIIDNSNHRKVIHVSEYVCADEMRL